MTTEKFSVERGVELAVRHPTCAGILAKNLSQLIAKEDWIDDQLKLKFCAKLLENIHSPNVSESLDLKLYKKIKRISLTKGLRLLQRDPDQGLLVIVALVIEQLRDVQKFDIVKQMEFYGILFAIFFPNPRNS